MSQDKNIDMALLTSDLISINESFQMRYYVLAYYFSGILDKDLQS